jgi:hypothetical protein
MLIPEYIRDVVMQRQLCDPSSLGRILHCSWQYPPLRTTVRKYGKKKLKCTLVQALGLCTGRTAHRGSRGIVLPFLGHGTRRWGVSVTPRPLFTPGKDPVLIVLEAGWDPRLVWTGALAPTGIRSSDRPAGSQSPYRLSYPAHSQIWVLPKRADNLSGVVTEGSERKKQ